jgi:thiamine pyrophosphokinase
MTRRAVVFVNGEVSEPELIRIRLAAWGDALMIGVDGGSRHAMALGIRLEAVIGDMDSTSEHEWEALEMAGASFEVAPTDKDETDLELALLYAVRHAASHIVCIGALGKRLDMTIANLFLLMHPGLAERRVEFWDGNQTAWLIRPPGDAVTGQPGDTLSLIPLAGPVNGITTHGLKYPLKAESLIPGPARGVSNVLSQARARVDLHSGFLLAIHAPGRA